MEGIGDAVDGQCLSLEFAGQAAQVRTKFRPHLGREGWPAVVSGESEVDEKVRKGVHAAERCACR